VKQPRLSEPPGREPRFRAWCDTLFVLLHALFVMRAHRHRTFFLAGPAGRLEAILWTPQVKVHPPLVAVVCHPHPLYGGTLHSKVIYDVAKTLDGFGLPVLRFNFRGAGRSAGVHDKGRGELDDVRTALGFLASEFPGLPILAAGFSFGCWVSLRVGCEDERVAELVGLGAPVNDSDFSFLARCAKPKLFLQGERDQYGIPAKLGSLVNSLPGENRLVIVDGADHFFAGKLGRVGLALSGWITTRHPELKH